MNIDIGALVSVVIAVEIIFRIFSIDEKLVKWAYHKFGGN
jgi:hypothetical protein